MDRWSTTLIGLAAATIVACGSNTESRQGFDAPATDPSGQEGDPGSPGDTPGSGGTTPDPKKPGCAQSRWAETLPNQSSLSGITFSSANANDYLLQALAKRYPIGKTIVEGGVNSSLAAEQGNCIDRFLDDKSSASSVLRGAGTVVHECGHLFDLGEGTGGQDAYEVKPGSPAVRFACKSGDTTSRGGKTFARSILKTDSYYASRKACGGSVKQGCDMYADIYLDGSATNSSFESGDQGFNSVLEEANQYVNSLATALAFKDQFTDQKSSDRDGILTFLWYIERYLAMAKSDYPAAYSTLSGDSCWRQAILSVWDRGWFYLDATKDEENLGIDDAAIMALAKDSTLTAEIDALRQLECK